MTSHNPKFVIAPTFVDDNGQTYSVSTMNAAAEDVEQLILSKPCVIPVLFLPGIMGTNLRDKENKKAVWRPPSTDLRGLADALLQLVAYAFTSAQSRAASLLMDRVEVDPNGPIDAGRSGLPINVLTLRGWGTIMRGSYHAFLSDLEYYLNNLARYDFDRCEVDFKEWAAEAGTEAPTEWGSSQGEALTRSEILHAARYQFDVWVGGYNWLQSNRDSGEQIKRYIEKEILPYYNDGAPILLDDTPDGKGSNDRGMVRKKPSRIVAEKVIVVTHSMGGFVSRALTEIHGCDKVLGVSHGVQPATGAPAAYKRMRAGFEGVAQVVLGRNAAEVTAVTANSPGALELLPTADYNHGKPWLFVREPQSADGSKPPAILALPKNGDPYSEIYQSSAWYGLVPEHNEWMLSFGAQGQTTQADRPAHQDRETHRKDFVDRIASVQAFHTAIYDRYKTPSYVHYCAQGNRDPAMDSGGLFGTGVMATQNRSAWGEVCWEGVDVAGRVPELISVMLDDGNGSLRTKDGVWLRIADPSSPGDGTVPIESGAAPKNKVGVALTFAHGHGHPGSKNHAFGYDHQDSYKDERALYASLYAIIKIAQDARWYPSFAQESE